MSASSIKAFSIPEHLNAKAPPEKRGIRRDEVKLMVTDRYGQTVIHSIFNQLSNYLRSGDVLILNNSRTIPAVLQANLSTDNNDQKKIEVRLARKLESTKWDALIIDHPVCIGERLRFSENIEAIIEKSYPDSPLMTISFQCTEDILQCFIYKNGEPIRYEYISDPSGLEDYQTVFGTVPGSVEMPSAGRPFSWEMLFALKKKGIQIGFVQLHTGLSYFMDDQSTISPSANPESYLIPAKTLNMIQKAKREGGKVIAVGTTVVRALESIIFSGLAGTTNLYIKQGFELKTVDGILTGFHEPEASHLDLLSAFIAPEHLLQAYDQAIDKQYLWHEFGDMHLIL